MKIFNQDQIHDWDRVTLEKESIKSIVLMERASNRIVDWITKNYTDTDQLFQVFCGPGNNGGDGLAVSRLLSERGYQVNVVSLQIGSTPSEDNQTNFQRLPKRGYVTHSTIKSGDSFPPLIAGSVIVDALFGSGLSRPIEGYLGELIQFINTEAHDIISIDVPSGLFIDEPTNHTTIRADHTLTLQAPKLSFFFPENHHAVGEWHILDIGLDDEWMNREPTSNYYFIPAMANTLLNKRSKFDHKGTFGHALLVCGAYGKMGAAVLAAKGCLRAGVGLLTAHIPASAYAIMQSSVPEAMVEVDTSENYFTGRPLDDRFTAIGMGCGIGKQPETRQAVLGLLDEYDGPLVLDADALNILAEEKDGFSKLPLHCILTPHPGEFERLAGTATDSFQILEKQRELSKNHQIYIVLKRGNTCITTPEGLTFFNSTGNPGMATGGSGDVLAGFITGLLAQGYASHEAATLGTYLHGLAGDIGAMAIGQNALIASDIIDHLGQAFQSIE